MSGTDWEDGRARGRASRVYKILRAAETAELVLHGSFDGSPDDKADGFVHLSTATQISETLAKHFAGEVHLFVGVCEAASLGEALRWEPSRGGALFPHLHRGLMLADIEALVPVRGDRDRREIPFVLPAAS